MNRIRYRQSMLAGFLSIGLAGAVLADSQGSLQEEELEPFSFLGPEPFEVCFDDHYYDEQFTADQAYARAQCFASLMDGNNSDHNTELGSLSSDKLLLLMQYTDSWLIAAAERGHATAQKQIGMHRVALNKFEGVKPSGMEQQLASEIRFERFDTDASGALNKWETIDHADLYATFNSKDIDSDGIVSKEEFMIFYGEATAAGPAATTSDPEQ